MQKLKLRGKCHTLLGAPLLDPTPEEVESFRTETLRELATVNAWPVLRYQAMRETLTVWPVRRG